MNLGRKVVIYLDQNFISDIAKLSLDDKKDRVKPELKEVFNAIKAGVDEEKFLSPTSWIHELETAAESNPVLRDAISSHQGYIGQVELKPSWEIKNAQFYNALLDGCGVTVEKTESWQDAFKDNPDKRMESFKIDVHIPDLGLGKLLPETAEALQKIRDIGVKEADQYALEIAESRKHYKTLLRTDFAWVLKKHDIPIERAEQFIDSEKFTQIPNINIFSRLWSRVLADKNRKRGIEGDYNDIEFLSCYMPYCAVMATDQYMKTQTQSLGLDQQYGCQLFSMKGNGLQELASHLEQLRAAMPPSNRSLFSVLAVMSVEKPTFPIEFLKKLNLAKSKFQSTGKYWNKDVYTEVFLLYPHKSEIKMPQSQDIRASGARSFTPDQWSEFLVFGHGFKKIFNDNGKSVEEVADNIPLHLRGAATAVISDSDSFDQDVRDHDSYLFYDIEEAIDNHLDRTKRYGIRILYPGASTPPAST